jgi:YVTN family beta-propeller protein
MLITATNLTMPFISGRFNLSICLFMACVAQACDCGRTTSEGEADADGEADLVEEAVDDEEADEAGDDPAPDPEADLIEGEDALPDVDIDVAEEEVLDCSLPEPPPGALLKMGLNPDGTVLMPGGRALTPAGPETEVDGFPQDVEVHPDGAVVYVTTTGLGTRQLVTIELATGNVLQVIDREEAFYGLAVHPDGSRVYASGGFNDKLEYYDVLGDGTLSLVKEMDIGGYPAGLAMNEDGTRLWVARFDGGLIGNGVVEIDTESMTIERTIPLLSGVFDVVKVPGHQDLYASEFKADKVHVINLDLGLSLTSVTLATQPAGLAAAPDGNRVWAAVSGGDEVAAIDVSSSDVTGRAWVGDITLPFLTEPLKNSNPNAVQYVASTDRLYVTRGADNAVNVLDASTMTVIGSIPTGWYPTDLAFTPDGETMVVACGKGAGMGPNPDNDSIGDWMRGTVMIVDIASGDLGAWTAQVEANYRRPENVFPFDFPEACEPPFPIPRSAGEYTPIEHVVLVVKENKTFDCVFGDEPGLEADPGLLLYGEDITPNQHALSRAFTIHDNFYTDSEVSVQGHLWLTGIFVNDFMERVWIENYRSGVFETDAVFDQGQPDVGTFFIHLIRHGIDFANYGEVVGSLGSEGGQTVMSHTDLSYPGVFFNLAVKDEEKANYTADKLTGGEFPPFVFVLIPNDHTHGTSPGELTPESMVNDNDYATGIIVDRISRSVYWDSTVIFIVEDDPQGCSDHVDAHRSFLIVVSPWARRGHVSHVHTSFLSVFRTIELILGLPPLGRTDAMATPLWDAFTNVPDDTPYTAIGRTIPDELNWPWLPGARQSAAMDFSGPDRVPSLLTILWPYRKWKMGEMTYEEAMAAAESCGPTEEEIEESRGEPDEYDRAWQQWKEWLELHPEVDLDQDYPPFL